MHLHFFPVTILTNKRFHNSCKNVEIKVISLICTKDALVSNRVILRRRKSRNLHHIAGPVYSTRNEKKIGGYSTWDLSREDEWVGNRTTSFERLKAASDISKILWHQPCPDNTCSSGYNQCLKVEFNDNGNSVIDHVCLKETSTCVYHGNFLTEVSTTVVVTKGCPKQDDYLEVSFKCDRVKGFRFLVDANGAPKEPENPRENYMEDEIAYPEDYKRISFPWTRSVTFPANGFEMDIEIWYDDNYRNTRHSGSDADALTEIAAVMAQVQTFFNLKDSLGTTIKINTKATTHLSGKAWTASSSNLE